MSFQLELPHNVVFIAGGILGWLIVLILVSRHYLKRQEKPSFWKVILVVLVGMFSFTINLNLMHVSTKLSILPLGVWILVGLLSKASWQTYRAFAWIGFWANFIFLFTTLMSGFMDNWVYPKEDASTYISDLENAYIVAIHPSGLQAVLNKERFQDQLRDVEAVDIMDMGLEWYQESSMESEPYYQKEHFPYALLGALPRWGSGRDSTMYIQDDGKGLLITTANQSYYYRSKEPLIDMGVRHDE
ncbi:hypothetical protein [Paenibacillus antarcticus]|uniref:Uncharacterized protein n=2 Tax=Paenibacillus antarcticus TaxID=253703 RepID=A0A168QXQ5_9BACL|nr:hypothetical protein [Paenibacillus antarcticus]OAB48339.1 hypothetical protein PBAT_01500 [Paenibacillus antarcticus]